MLKDYTNEINATTSLIIYEHYVDQPESPFGKCLEHHREQYGSMEMRSDIYKLSVAIEEAFDAMQADFKKQNRFFSEELFIKHGCYDFESMPKFLDLIAGSELFSASPDIKVAWFKCVFTSMVQPDLKADLQTVQEALNDYRAGRHGQDKTGRQWADIVDAMERIKTKIETE